MLAMQSSNESHPVGQRPFSWCLRAGEHRSAAGNKQYSQLATAHARKAAQTNNYTKHYSDISRSSSYADKQNLRGKSPTQLPPVLPAGFRNFSRYLDTKFGPDSSSTSVEENLDVSGELSDERMAKSHRNKFGQCDNSSDENKEDCRNFFSPDTAVQDYDNDQAKLSSWPRKSSLTEQHNPSQLRHAKRDRSLENVNLSSPSQVVPDRLVHTGPSSPASSLFADPRYPTHLAQFIDPFGLYYRPEEFALAEYSSKAYLPPIPLSPYTWTSNHHTPTPQTWLPFIDLFGWWGVDSTRFYAPQLPTNGLHGPPFVPFPPPPRVAFNPVANWFRAAASHFASAALFADYQPPSASPPPSTVPTYRSASPVSESSSFPNTRPKLTRFQTQTNQNVSFAPMFRSPGPENLQSRISEGENAGNQSIPSRYFRARRVSDPSVCGQRNSTNILRMTTANDIRRGSDSQSAVQRSFDELELPQDPALILADQLDFYLQIQDLLELDANISLPLPAGWSLGVSKSGRRFFICDRMRSTTWQHPIIISRIPLCWERVEMRDNCVYYRHLLIPHSQRHHPDLWFPTTLKTPEIERQDWFCDLRQLQESVSNFVKGKSKLVEDYADSMDKSEDAKFLPLFKNQSRESLENLVQHLDCRFFRDLHRIVVAYEVSRIKIVRQLLSKNMSSSPG